MNKTRRLFLGLACTLAVLAGATGSMAQNVVANGDFEGAWRPSTINGEVAVGWTEWSPINNSYWHMPDRNPTTPSAENDFQRMIGGNIQSLTINQALVQAVPTTPGQQYAFDFEGAFTFILWGGDSDPWGTGASFGYDLTGQTADPNAASVSWTPMALADWWNHYSTRFTATGVSTSIWFRSQDGTGQRTHVVDLDNVVVEPTSLGAILLIDPEDAPAIRVIQINDTTFQIEWTTDVASDSTVEYDTQKPGKGDEEGIIAYANSENDPAQVTNHSVVISGLTPDTVYNFRVLSSAAGSKTLVSLNHTLQTPGTPLPAFYNGSFEIGFCGPGSACNGVPEGWIEFGVVDGRQGPAPATGGASWFGVKASEGDFFVGSAGSYVTKNGGYYQRIEATPGNLYTAEFDYKNFAATGNPSEFPVGTHIGIDPTGGINPDAASVVWMYNWDLSSGPSDPWKHSSVSATAQSDAVTVFIRFEQKFGLPFNVTVADNVTFGAPAEVANIGQARELPNSTPVTITDAQVVTLVADAPSLETGFFYAESPDGAAGIRVETEQDPLPSVGDLVTLSGVINTNPATGEKTLTQATFTSSGTGSVPIWTLTNKALGGEGYYQSQGLSNQGLLVRAFGEVKAQGFDDDGFLVLYLDDGSANGDADRYVKVIKSDWFVPNVGDYVSIVGVVASEIVNGNQIKVLRGRHNSIITDVECFTCP